MKKKIKRSFFERLTGTMNPEVIDEEFLDHDLTEEKKEGAIYNGLDDGSDKEKLETNSKEEIGELGIDMFEEGDKIIIQTMIAGVPPDNVDIKITRDKIRISGKRQVIKQILDDDYYHKELYWGNFVREIKLPYEIDPEKAEALEKHGLLELQLPRLDRQEAQSLRVKTL